MKRRRTRGRTRKRQYSRKFTGRMQSTLLMIFALLVVCFLGLLGSIMHIQQKNGDRYGKRVLSQQSYVNSVLEYKRGDILDRNSTTLATSTLRYNVIIDPKLILSKDEIKSATIEAITSYFDITEADLREIIEERPQSQYYPILKNVDKETVDTFRAKMDEEKAKCKKNKTDFNVEGITFEKTYKRNYPLNSAACSVIGFASANNEGLWGLENQYNEELNGVAGRIYGYYNSDTTLERTVKAAQNGNTLVTTLDMNIQSIVEKKIDKFMKNTGAKNVAALVMNPKNGEIYAMSSNIHYDLNNAFDLTQVYSEKKLASLSDEEKSDLLNEMWSNFCVSYSFEPGSTYKPITVAAALEEGLVTDKSTFVCDGGEDISGTYIRCVSRYGHGTLTLAGSLMESCNDVMMQITTKMGATTFLKYMKDFNIGQKTGIDLPGETAGLAFTEDTMGPTELATSGFGQGTNVNMIQIASAFSSIINGGNYYKPHVVKQILDDDGNVVENIDPVLVRKNISEDTSELLRKYLLETVEDGTGATAAVPGYSIGGKTGTAEKLPRGNGKYLVSFIGAAPMDDPEVVVYVVVDEPNVEEQAHSTYAQEVVHNIFKEILPFLGIYRDEAKWKEDMEKKQQGTTVTTQESTAQTEEAAPATTDTQGGEQTQTAEVTQEPVATQQEAGVQEPDAAADTPTTDIVETPAVAE